VAPYAPPQGVTPPAPRALAIPPAFFPRSDWTPAPAAAVAAVSASRPAILPSLLVAS
jgi:hypothetical protein